MVICENGGLEALQRLVDRLPVRLPGGQTITIVGAHGNVGYAAGVNLAIAQAPDADAWWVLNPDTQPEPGALAACVDRLEKGDCDAVGAAIHLPNKTVQSYGGRWQVLLARAVSLGHGVSALSAVNATHVERHQNFISGACMLVTRRFVQITGPMSEDYFLYCEEVEWFLRSRALGMRLGFAPEARVLHQVGTTTGSGESFNRMPKTPVYLNERNRILLTRDLFPALLPAVAAGALCVIAMRFARRGAWVQLGFALQGWIAGLRNQRGAPTWISDAPIKAL